MSQQLPDPQNQQSINSVNNGSDYVGGDKTTVSNIQNSEVVAIGRGAIAAKGNVTIYKGEAYPRLNYRIEILELVKFYTQTFVGRRAEIPQLIEFSAQKSPGYLLVEAVAGFGKSALMYQLLHLHETGSWKSHLKPYLLYFFIRQQGNRNTPVSFLQALNSQLLEILNLSGGVPNELSVLRNQFSELWSQALLLANREQPLLLLVDGLDEMAVGGDVTIADLLPSLTFYTHVIVTSRPNPEPLQLVSLEHSLKKAHILRLQKFDQSDIKALLQKYTNSVEIVANLSLRILEITKGEPLFARFVCQDVAAKGEPALSQLEKNPPADVEAYFQEQLKQLASVSDEEGEIAWNILGLLVVTLGGITIEEMAEVLKENKRKVRKAIDLIQRFLLGDSQVTLMHLQLRKVLTEEFSHRDQVENRQKLLDFCAYWQKHHSRYALAYYAQHLVEA
ncbi:NACHT domain-containing protein [Nostoc sp. FACHB-145]|uniref:NACHT domain-containing protein n=1 Tax=Nostoc sp. FACHB-145 TaxID=2692836 RepID=UPI001681E184|nr:NACHT domain-containing protein [Nostoc sp. FACHB-145]MBD2472663.1 NACHT domain-containing protein [Nostoc sp. FACHB-145]